MIHLSDEDGKAKCGQDASFVTDKSLLVDCHNCKTERKPMYGFFRAGVWTMILLSLAAIIATELLK